MAATERSNNDGALIAKLQGLYKKLLYVRLLA